MTDPNERMGLLLGWLREESRDGKESWMLSPHGVEFLPVDSDNRPDYRQWTRFPELQEYVRSIGAVKGAKVRDAIMKAFSMQYADRVEWGVQCTTENITPTILRDAILEVCEPARPQDRE